MQITTVTMDTSDAREAARFWGGVLGLPVEQLAGALVVHIGHSRLVVNGSGVVGEHHLAITIPTGKADAARAWLLERVPLLAHTDPESRRTDDFSGTGCWNSRSFYFDGPDCSILELIERRDLDNGTDGPFSVRDFLCISEVGVAVDDVPDVTSRLADAAIAPYCGPGFPDFAPTGGADGMLIMVGVGRPWFPTGDRTARHNRLFIEAVGERAAAIPLGEDARLVVYPAAA